MTRWGIGIVALIITVASIVLIRNAVKAKRGEERHAQHQAALTKFTQALKPGITRKQVEDYLRTQNLKFGRICCNQHQDVYATEVRVGQEDSPWFCSGWGVYVDFEFTTIEPDRYPLRPPADGDILSNLHLVSKGESCL
jgi:hypothetical protein